ncbi:translocation protein TolB [Fulvivirga ulvae]|uniref:translocation protein TolB n=1 Tax=Fulvivirga ulvae TaxID=2904245 RepID=UPI001F2ACBA0|nr:translocation protein TolB [Fulvivirga ulvae]UII33539.1 translocation protein TolB [Fulvivirga ulvae]
MKSIKNFLLTIIAISILSHVSMGQSAMEKFGRNRVQYEQFDWRYLSSDNFDVYFYKGGDKIAKEVTEYLEEEFERVTDIIGYPPYSKTKLFLYNSISDLQQSNIGINDHAVSAGGETQFVKSHIEIANPGNIDALKEELLYKVSSLMVNEMMFGGSLKDMFQSSVLLNLPEWFINGASLYVSKGWSIEMDDYARELVNTRHPRKFGKLTGNEAALAGQSLWNFIAEKYGKSNISNILNYTRIIRNEEKSIAITLGVSFDQVMYEWQNFYTDIDRQVNENYVEPKKENRIIKKNRKDIVYSYVKLNPDGTRLSYTYNYKGRYHVYIRDLATGREKDVLSAGDKVINQEIDHNIPLIDWVDENTLGIVFVKKGQLYFTLYDAVTNSKLPRRLDKFEQVRSMDFSDNGRLMIISGVVDGKNDLYLLSTRRDRVKRLTDDVYDDLDPSFVPNSNTVVFSSNRVSDTLNTRTKDFETVGDNFNLFFYNLDTTENVLHRVTNTISRDVKPLALSSSRLFYLSDQKGITNLFSYNLSTGIYTQVTNFSSSIENYDIDFGSSKLAFVMDSHGKDYIYYYPEFNYDQQIFTPLTTRQQVLQAKAFRLKRNQEKKEALTVKEIVEQRLAEAREEKEEQKQDTVITEAGFIDTDNYQFDVEEQKEQEEVINTDNYTFDTDILKEEQKDSFLAQYRKLRKGNKISGPFPYDTRFSTDHLVTSLVIDPLRGFGILMETEMNDMLENHKFSGGIMATVDLRSGDIFAEYQYLKNRVDYSVRYDREVIFRDSEMLHKYSKNAFELGAAYPFNPKTRIALKPFYAVTRFENLEPTLVGSTPTPMFSPSSSEQYGGATVELVFDNSIINGMNLIEGSRAKVRLKHYEGLTDQNKSFTNLSADFRHYQKIYKEIVLAGRLYYGSFFGKSPKQYLLGGMDNWMFFDENTEGTNNPLKPNAEKDNSDLLFIEYATNLRGFDYGALYGRNTLLFNAELRVPLIRALSSGPITSNFFRNLQFIGFFDIGSAWTGKSPFREDNSISTKVIPEDPAAREKSNFIIELKNYRSPWIYSYGAGFRTIILGYYIKLDVAWPVDNYDIGSPRAHLTLGYDF